MWIRWIRIRIRNTDRKHDKLTVLKVLDGGPEGGEVRRPHGLSGRDPPSGLVLQEGGQKADSCSRNDDILERRYLMASPAEIRHRASYFRKEIKRLIPAVRYELEKRRYFRTALSVGGNNYFES